MMADRQLSRNFWVHEFPCWERATGPQVEALAESVALVWQPTRDRWGPIVPTSWRWWSAGCVPRTGSHGGTGGTIDAVPIEASTRDVFEWMRDRILPGGHLGRLIYEPNWWEEGGATPAGPDDVKTQGEHIHAATRADMARIGVSDVGAFDEVAPGQYAYAGGGNWDGHSGVWGDPIPLPGVTARVSPAWGRWLLLGAVGLAAAQERAGR